MMMNKKSRRIIFRWLMTGCFLIFLMVIIGGITRLTHSGLSMVEWDLVMGSIPPTNEEAWQETFEKYKQFPEYQKINYNFTLEDFKAIFWWEYLHRMLGRVLGLVFIIPFFYFLFKKMLTADLLKKLLIILFLGGLQGAVGWYMVKSGLVDEPDVSHYRLALHLLMAFITFAYTFWVALDLLYAQSIPRFKFFKDLKRWTAVLLIILIVQITYGAFVAGLNAGMVYNTFPKMGDKWVAESVTAMEPVWLNFIEGVGGVQFIHRYLAYIVFGIVLLIWIKGRKKSLHISQKKGINFLLFGVLLQFLLGVLTLLYSVPVVLGVLHQVGAFILLGAVVFCLHRFSAVRN